MGPATLTPAACDQSDSSLLVACVQLQGSDGPGQCAQGQGILPAQVYFQPYRPGATYISTGRGCSLKGNPPQPVCLAAGPFTPALYAPSAPHVRNRPPLTQSQSLPPPPPCA